MHFLAIQRDADGTYKFSEQDMYKKFNSVDMQRNSDGMHVFSTQDMYKNFNLVDSKFW